MIAVNYRRCAPLRLLHHGEFPEGGNSTQRGRAFDQRGDVVRLQHEVRTGADVHRMSFYAKARWRLRLPIDVWDENQRLMDAAQQFRPDVVLVENSKVISRHTLRRLRETTGARLAFLSSDDIVAPHNLSFTLRDSLSDWDFVFTTKRFNVAELLRMGVKRPVLLSNMYDPSEHRPLDSASLGADFEVFDLVFVGTYEAARCRSINALAEAGLSIHVCGNDAGVLAGGWRSRLHRGVVYAPAVSGEAYARALHGAKIALCFLRKLNRDEITTRSVEIPACGRCMLAEKSAEHDAHFKDGIEYISFSSNQELVAKAQMLLANAALRQAVAAAGRHRCRTSPWTVAHFVDALMTAFRKGDAFALVTA